MVTFESPQLELIQQLIGGAESVAVRAVSKKVQLLDLKPCSVRYR